MRVIKSTGSTIHTHTFHGKVSQIPHIQSYAALRLLQAYYHVRDKDYLEDNFMTRINFSRNYLTEQLKIHGDLVCNYCGKKHLQIELAGMNVPKSIKATIDHVIPISKGGGIYDVNNLVIACFRCNMNKGNMMPDEFAQKLARAKEHWQIRKEKREKKAKQLSPVLV